MKIEIIPSENLGEESPKLMQSEWDEELTDV